MKIIVNKYLLKHWIIALFHIHQDEFGTVSSRSFLNFYYDFWIIIDILIRPKFQFCEWIQWNFYSFTYIFFLLFYQYYSINLEKEIKNKIFFFA